MTTEVRNYALTLLGLFRKGLFVERDFDTSRTDGNQANILGCVAAECEELSRLLNGLKLRLVAMHYAEQLRARDKQLMVVSAGLISSFVSLNSISALLRGPSMQVRDALILARTFYEGAVNVAFLLGDMGERSKRAEQYAILKTFQSQKVFRRLGMSSAVFINDRGLARADPIVEEALEAFKSPLGEAHKSGRRESRKEMLNVICEEMPLAGTYLLSVEQQVYELTSELTHGSFFGFMEVNSGGDFANGDGLAGNAELVRFAVILSSTAMATAVRSTFGSCEYCDRLELVGEEFIRGLAKEAMALDEPFTIRTHRK